jgi:hypothetical protein
MVSSGDSSLSEMYVSVRNGKFTNSLIQGLFHKSTSLTSPNSYVLSVRIFFHIIFKFTQICFS